MKTDRVSLALEMGALALPDGGPIALYTPDRVALPGALPKERLKPISPWQMDVTTWQSQGLDAAIDHEGPFVSAVVMLPRSRVAGQIAIARAMARTLPGGYVLIDGQKTSGIDRFLKDMKSRLPIVDSFVKFHGRLFWVQADPEVLSDWMALDGFHKTEAGFYTGPGQFSPEGPDQASRSLADALPKVLPPRMADFGAGWGYLGAQVLAREGVTSVDLIEAHDGALAAAKLNLSDSRAHFHWADATQWRPEEPYDGVVMNPPFHSARAADPGLGQAFIQAAASSLTPKGRLWLVANRQLPYEALLNELFRQVSPLPAPAGFKILVAEAPRSPRQKGGKIRLNREEANS